MPLSFPQASSNSICRNDDAFHPANVIDGRCENQGHAKDFPSWGPEQQKDPWLKIAVGSPSGSTLSISGSEPISPTVTPGTPPSSNSPTARPCPFMSRKAPIASPSLFLHAKSHGSKSTSSNPMNQTPGALSARSKHGADAPKITTAALPRQHQQAYSKFTNQTGHKRKTAPSPANIKSPRYRRISLTPSIGFSQTQPGLCRNRHSSPPHPNHNSKSHSPCRSTRPWSPDPSSYRQICRTCAPYPQSASEPD